MPIVKTVKKLVNIRRLLKKTTPAVYFDRVLSKISLNFLKRKKGFFSLVSFFKKRAHKAGLKVNAFIAEKITAVAIVTANCW